METEKLQKLRQQFLDPQTPLFKRFGLLWGLRMNPSNESVEILAGALQDDSALLKHEICYVMGQIQNPHAIPHLVKTLSDEKEDPMVRHEAGEALGAIGLQDSLPILEKFSSDPIIEVAETCQIAVDRIKWKLEQKALQEKHAEFQSVDPAPPCDDAAEIEKLRGKMMDRSLSLFNRYRAIFALRNLNSDESALALASGLDDESALFRHEVAYVLGQMARKSTVQPLKKVLERDNEHPMVRHEAAEAIGAVGDEECVKILETFKNDRHRVVRESCDVGLSISEGTDIEFHV
eukprot:TRINITY_DN2776_c0_g1_i1.p1 TRINITY_DN2776_c0_g1~~TRINITY_DN2776_c0_g1_i1.p1  ORF type:complete len:291 (-),score=76.52 TRINITY_DN2776_c0_g1_i1:240-1112(-)